MKLQILPNWCKKLGLGIFIFFSFFEGRDGFIEGLTGLPYNSLQNQGFFTFREYFGESFMLLFGTLSLIGVIIYMISREKVEDDYINMLRLESFKLTFIFNVIIALLLFIFKKEMIIELDFYLSFFLLIYLITFAIKKRLV